MRGCASRCRAIGQNAIGKLQERAASIERVRALL